MDIEILREFTAFCKTSSLSEASRIMHVSQPTLSRHLESLEAKLGAKLTIRTNTGFSLTKAGGLFLEDALDIVVRYDNAIARVKEASRGKTRLSIGGSLRVRSLDNIALLAISLAAKQQKPYDLTIYSPHTSDSIPELAINGGLEALRQGHVDIALLPASRRIRESGFCIRPLFSEAFEIFIPEDDDLAKAEELRMEDFRNKTFVFTQAYKDLGLCIIETLRSAGFEPKTKIRVSDVISQHATALESCAFTCPSSSTFRYPPTPISGLVRANLVDSRAVVQLAAVYDDGKLAKEKEEVAELMAEVARIEGLR